MGILFDEVVDRGSAVCLDQGLCPPLFVLLLSRQRKGGRRKKEGGKGGKDDCVQEELTRFLSTDMGQ